MGNCYLDGIGFCIIGPLAPGQSAVVQNSVIVPLGIFEYRAQVKQWENSGDADPNPANDTGVVRVAVGPQRRRAVRR